MTVLIGIAFKSLLIAALTLGLLELMKRRSAAERSWIAHAGLFALVLMAVAPLAMPSYTVEGPALFGKAPAAEAAAPAVPDQAKKADKLDVTALALSTVAPKAAPKPQPVATPSRLTATATTMILYAIPAAILLFITFLALARLVALQAKAEVLVDGHWLSALARAQRRMGFKHGTALLTSNELASPISWGLMRPVIVLNRRAVEAQNEAEAIIAHELAHVARMDWVKLLLARVATALFWFNPLVWLLARESHQLREEAADDAVLAADIPDTDYAELLVGVARHDCPGLLLGAHGVAPSKSSLSRRVARVLDSKIMRGPAAGSFAAGVFVGAVVIAAPLAALTLVPNGTVAAKKAAAAASPDKQAAYAPYYPESAPTDLPSIISQGVSTSVQTAVAAIGPTINRATNGDVQAVSPSGASVTTHDGITTAIAASGATTTVYPADAHGRRKVVMRGPNGATVVTYADSDDDIPGAVSAPFREKNEALRNAIAMKAVGMTPEYMAEMRNSTRELRDADIDDMMGMKAVGVTPAYVRDLTAAGLRNFDASDVAGARAVGVDGNFIREMRAAGFGDADLSDLTGARAVGISGSYIRQMRLAGYDGDLGDFIALRSLSGSKRVRPTMPPLPPAPPRLPSH
jgi:beta-lactamase regulating signal transducer with metallopeptidase domain